MQENFNKDLYRELTAQAKESNVRFFSIDLTDSDYPYNGLSIAYRLNPNIPDCRMIDISVSYCAPEDTFKAKRGKFQALHKMFCTGEFIKLPLGDFYREIGGKKYYMEEVLSSMFMV